MTAAADYEACLTESGWAIYCHSTGTFTAGGKSRRFCERRARQLNRHPGRTSRNLADLV